MVHGIRAKTHEQLEELYSQAYMRGSWSTLDAIKRELHRRANPEEKAA